MGSPGHCQEAATAAASQPTTVAPPAAGPGTKTASLDDPGPVSRSGLPVPKPCGTTYARYAAALERSGLALAARASLARDVRRFMHWLAAEAGDTAAAALAQPRAWEQAVARFTADVRASAGPPAAQRHRDALSDLARRLGLAEPFLPIPHRLRWVHDSYTAALAQGTQAAATIRSNLSTADSFLRWLGAAGYDGDLRGDWDRAAEGYLRHLVAGGNAATSVRRRRVALNDCARRLGLPQLHAVADPVGAAAAAAADAGQAPHRPPGHRPRRRGAGAT